MSKYIDEIKNGGIQGICGIDQIEWPAGRGDKLYECWKCEPCCGRPCNAKDACYCLAIWYCCNIIPFAKMYGSSMNQPCACIPHLLCAYVCPQFTLCFMRYNIRKMNGVRGNLCGDAVCTYFCSWCSMLQLLRGVPVSAWDPFPCNCVCTPPQMMLLV
mgnify:CR=1 FL=1